MLARSLIKRVAQGERPFQVLEALDVTPEMEELFVARTNEHIRLVQKYAETLAFRFSELADLPRLAASHDASKFGPEERLGYVKNTWTYKHEGQCYRGPEMADSWAHHQRANDHHPEYWDDPQHMTDPALAHAVSDWAAMSEELGTSLSGWVEQNAFTKWNWSPSQVERIRELVAATGRP